MILSTALPAKKKRFCPQIANKPLAGAHLPGGHSRVYSAVMSSDLCTIGAFDWLLMTVILGIGALERSNSKT